MAADDVSLMDILSGWDGYQRSLVTAIAPRTRKELLYRPCSGRRSAGEIAGHIAFGRIDWFDRMGATGSAALAEEIALLRKLDSSVDEVIAEDASKIVHWLEKSWAMVEGVLSAWTVEDLKTTYNSRIKVIFTPYRTNGSSGGSWRTISIMAAS